MSSPVAGDLVIKALEPAVMTQVVSSVSNKDNIKKKREIICSRKLFTRTPDRVSLFVLSWWTLAGSARLTRLRRPVISSSKDKPQGHQCYICPRTALPETGTGINNSAPCCCSFYINAICLICPMTNILSGIKSNITIVQRMMKYLI